MRTHEEITDSIDDGVTGLLVDSRDDLIAATRTLLADPAVTRSLGSAAREAAQGYSWSATADGFDEVFGRVNPLFVSGSGAEVLDPIAPAPRSLNQR